MAKSQGKNVAFTVPKEGGVQWAGIMQSCVGFSPKLTELSQRYMNPWLSDECQLAWIERGFFSPTSSKVKIPDAMKQNAALMSTDDAVKKLVKPDFEKLGSIMPRLKTLIDRTLKA